ncbi:MAG TPA: acetoacetate--CoA ligase, partial [Gammaproteobacteria bacterium]|nr:acetoacetate--CoA ligase [Gammaproteobacteria bacterium]
MTENASSSTAQPVWTPRAEDIADANLTDFMAVANKAHGLSLESYEDLYRWSVDAMPTFWAQLWDYCDVQASVRGERLFDDHADFTQAQFFPEARLNFAENLLRRDDDSDAIVFQGEDKVSARLSWAELRLQVAQFAAYLKACGVKPG